ncbi:hypothetical protein [Synechococcus sp. MIT S1220]
MLILPSVEMRTDTADDTPRPRTTGIAVVASHAPVCSPPLHLRCRGLALR